VQNLTNELRGKVLLNIDKYFVLTHFIH